MSGQETTFSIRNLTIVIVISAISLTLTLYFFANKGNKKSKPGFSSVTYDKKALGMRALVDLMLRLGMPVSSSSAFNSGERNGIILMPDVRSVSALQRARTRYSRAKAVLFILPKRRFSDIDYYNLSTLNAIMLGFGNRNKVVRTNLDIEKVGGRLSKFEPTISNAQLITGSGFKTLISANGGALLAEMNPNRSSYQTAFYVLADPDPVQNHGLDDGFNAEFAIDLVNTLRAAGGRIIIDDSGGGSVSTPTIWRELFRFPLLALTLTILAVFVLVCLQSLTRFGTVEPDRARLRPGRDTILDASTSLVIRDGHYSAILQAYWQQTLRSVGKRFNAPTLSDNNSILEHLTNIENSIDPSVRYIDIYNRLENQNSFENKHQIIRTAGMIHQWQKEMLRATK